MKQDRDIQGYIDDILESIGLIEDYTAGLNTDKFCEDIQVQDSVIRRLGIIGEAANNIPDEVREKYAIIPWHKITGLRNVVIHEYKKVSLVRIWDTVVKDLPELKQHVKKIRL